MSVSADYIHSVGKDQFVNREINPAVRVDTTRTGALTRTDLLGHRAELGLSPFAGSVQVRDNVGSRRYDGLNLALEKRYSHNFSGRVSYAIGKARGNVNGGLPDTANFQFLDDLNLDHERGAERLGSHAQLRAQLPRHGAEDGRTDHQRRLPRAERPAVDDSGHQCRSGSQRHPVRSAPGRHVQRHGRQRHHGRERRRPKRRARAGLRAGRHADRLSPAR